MNLERDLEYSERSTKGKKILAVISIILAGLLIISLLSIIKVKGERDSLRQQVLAVQKEKGITQQKMEDLAKENEALKGQLASVTQEKDRLSKELSYKKTSPPKKTKKRTK